MTKETEEKTRQERQFIYQDKEHVVIGHVKARYEPNIKADVYGAIEVFIDFPAKQNQKTTYALSLYPIPLEKDADLRSNIGPVKDGINNLFIESNKVAASMIRILTGVKVAQFKYSNMGIMKERDDDDDDVIMPDGSVYKSYASNGKVVHSKPKGAEYLRKGDKVMIASCLELIDKETKKSSYVWECKYNPKNAKFGWFDRYVRKPLWKLFKKEFYEKRYNTSSTFALKVNDVLFQDITPVEETSNQPAALGK